MQIRELGQYIKENIGTILVMVIILTPSIWAIADRHYNERITTLEEKIDYWKNKNNTLEVESKKFEDKSNGYKELLVKESVIDWSEIKN